MTDLVFVTESRLFDRDIHGAISRSFFAKAVSSQALEVTDSENVLWIVVKRNSEYYLQSRLKIDLIQRYTEGRMSGWYAVSCSKNFGGHIFPPNDLHVIIDASSELKKFPESDTLDTVSHSLANILLRNYSATLRRTNLRLNNDNRRRFLMSYVEKNINEFASLSVNQIELELRDNFYEGELFLLAILQNNSDPYLSTSIEIFSVINDVPLASLSSYTDTFKYSNKKQRVRKYFIDCMLRTFTEDDLVAREMIWNPDNFGEDKFKAGLLKTNLAEHRHQEILRQLITQLVSKGIVPLGSSSIDLAIDFNDAIAIFEIKSSTILNYKDQAFKGCNQLNEYAFNLSKKSKKNIFKFLILEIPTEAEVDAEYVSAICKLMNVITIDFNFEMAWPDRCVIPDYSMMKQM
jgi:hypothetical protein